MKEPVEIIIDSSDNNHIFVGIKTARGNDAIDEPLGTHKSQVVLSFIEKLLHRQKLTIQDVTSITVHEGPGSFTGLRVGVSIGNALSALLQIPINNMKPGTIVEPKY